VTDCSSARRLSGPATRRLRGSQPCVQDRCDSYAAASPGWRQPGTVYGRCRARNFGPMRSCGLAPIRPDADDPAVADPVARQTPAGRRMRSAVGRGLEPWSSSAFEARGEWKRLCASGLRSLSFPSLAPSLEATLRDCLPRDAMPAQLEARRVSAHTQSPTRLP